MPRGVYERKPKAAQAAAPAQKKQVAKTAIKVKKVAKPVSGPKEPAPATFGYNNVAQPDRAVTESYRFQLLGQNITTLSEARERAKDNPELEGVISAELAKTIGALSVLRQQVFGDLTPTAEPKAEEVEEETEGTAPAPVAAPVNNHTESHPAHVQAAPSAPSLPQGNAGFVPPAPPAIPHH